MALAWDVNAWISVIDFPQPPDEKPDKHKVPIKDELALQLPAFSSRQFGHTSALGPLWLLSSQPSFYHQQTRPVVKLSSACDQNSAIPLGPPLCKFSVFHEAMPREDLSSHAN